MKPSGRALPSANSTLLGHTQEALDEYEQTSADPRSLKSST